MSEYVTPERIVLVGYGPVGARFVEELLPLVRQGAATLTVVGAESADAYNRELIAEYAVGPIDRDSLEITDTLEAREAGVHVRSWPDCRYRPESWSTKTCRVGATRRSTRSATARPWPRLPRPAIRARFRPAGRAA